jgi:hypothetical protein
MKIKIDFVTNSSSTSFLIITKGNFEKKDFRKLAGVTSKSLLTPLIDSLYEIIEKEMEPVGDYIERNRSGSPSISQYITDNFNPDISKRVLDALDSGKNVYLGKLRTEGNSCECFFSGESFELDGKDIYLNAINCTY